VYPLGEEEKTPTLGRTLAVVNLFGEKNESPNSRIALAV